MFKLFTIAPFVLLLTACASNFGIDAKDALTYQQALNQNAVGQRVIVGGPIISYNYTQYSTQIEITNQSNASERAIIVIPELISEERLQNTRISAVGNVREIAQLNRYGNSTVIMVNASDYKIVRAAKPMFDPTNKPRYGYTYKFES